MIKSFIMRYHFIIYMVLSFYILDLCIRYSNLDVNIGTLISFSPNIFSLGWILLFVAILLLFNYRLRKTIYLVLIIFFDLLFITNFIYFALFGNFFSFQSISLASEGMNYFNTIFNFINLPLIICLILNIGFIILTIKFMPKEKIWKDKIVVIVLIFIAIGFYTEAKIHLGKPVNNMAWNAWKHKRNIYNSFTDTRKSIQICGYYEYVMRDVFVTFFKSKKVDHNTINYLDKHFKNNNIIDVKDDWTGTFKDKNVIIVLMESIDSWLLTKDIMPTLYDMMHNNSINLTNHFTPIYGGGATFNSEFIFNTGYMTPFNGGSASYNYGKNYFPYSLANLFYNAGYEANQIHFNKGEYYNRRQMSKIFGYEHYYSSLDMGIPRKEAVMDSHLMTDEKMRDLILPDKKFMDFIITYSAHMPYNLKARLCSQTTTAQEKELAKTNEEFTCIKAQARETDNFFKLLLENLKSKNLIDKTVIVAYTDHFTYALKDRESVYELKKTHDYNLVEQTPAFIWSNNAKEYNITNVTTNLDLLPTIADLFGLDWNSKNYLGQSIFEPDYNDFAFFGDYSWYDGQVYYKNNKVIIGDNIDNNYIDNHNKKINDILKLNKAVLDSNYFKRRK